MSQRPLRSALPRIDGYRVEGVLGRGSTGIVYSAIQLTVDRPVAIKVLHPELAGRRAAVKRLQREARTTARLAHPGIISAIDMGEQDGLWWYAMELVEGISLGERLVERGPMTEREALRFFLPLVDALQHACEGGVVHRDIKPSNILVDSHGRARLVDLGLAFAEDDPRLTRTGGTLGTPHYISPEQARDPSVADTRSDLWSLGATMYHAVCGRPPFEGSSVAEILSGVLYQRVPDPRLFAPALSRNFTLVLRKCLTREASGRYAEPEALLLDLEQLVERRAPSVRVRSLDPVDDGRPAWLRRALLGGGAAAALLSGLLLWSPWSTPVPESSVPVAAEVAWPALDRLSERYEAGMPLADVVVRLGGLSAPPGAEPRRAALGDRLQLDLDQALQGVVDELESELDDALASGRLALVLELLGAAPALVQGATGYTGLEQLPAGPARRRLERLLQGRGVRLAQAREVLVRQAEAGLLSYLERSLIPKVEAARDSYRWRTARKLLDSREDWSAAAGVPAGLLPEDEVKVLDSAEDLLVPVSTTLFAHYRRVTEDLERYLQEQDAELREQLGAGRSDSAGELRARFEARLVSLGLERQQVPSDYRLRRSLDGRLEDLVQALGVDEDRVLEGDARDDYRADLALVDGLLRDRRYAEVLALWDQRLADPWRAASHGDMQARRREAELLEGVLQAAGAALRAAHGQQLEVTLDGITHSAGVIATRPAHDLVEDGVDLDLPGLERPIRVGLRRLEQGRRRWPVLPPSSLFQLAALPDAGEGAFVRALFFFHEGRLKEAFQVLPPGPIKDTVLLNELRVRLEIELDLRRDLAASRLEEKGRRIRALRRDVDNGRSTYLGMLKQGRRLLTEFADLLTEDERSMLEAVCEDCTRQLSTPTVAQRYPTAVATRRFNGVVTLHWGFDDPGVGAWQLGAWEHSEGRGLLRLEAEPDSYEHYWASERALGLPLGSPLASDETLDLSLSLRWAEEHAEFDNDLVLSIAGIHLLFVDGLGEREDRWLVTRDDPRPALETLRKESEAPFTGFTGFPREEAFELRVQLTPGRGRMKVWVDGRQLSMPNAFLKADLPEEPELLLRSWYAIELQDVRLEARLQ